ncbi:MAG: 50S ribosomal protein L9 [Nitrospirota bacterium]
MKIILQEDISRLGKAGDLIDVASGYARNYLVPKKMAVEANPRNIKELEHAKRLIMDKQKTEKKEAEILGENISKVQLTIAVQVGEEDKMFGSVTNKDIAEALEKEEIIIDRKKIIMDKHIKELGIYNIPIKLSRDVMTEVKVWVVKA